MSLDKKLTKDIFEWDTYNWSKALPFWNEYLTGSNLKCLEIGASKGGPSLWLASKGHSVVCSDIRSPKEKAQTLHSSYRVQKVIYEALDATDIPYKNEFDIIIFKSILGGISRDGNEKMKQVVIDQMYSALKPKGKLLFAENLAGSSLHKFARSKTRKWGSSWNYLEYTELNLLFKDFSKTNFKTSGFFSAFGPNELMKKILGMIDSIFSWMIPRSRKYIVFGAAEK